MKRLILMFEEGFEVPMPVVGALVLLDADETFNLSGRDLVTVKRSDIHSGTLGGEVLVGGFRCQGVVLLV